MENINISIKRHSLSHILAQAVKSVYPGAKLAIGPAIDNGFYYDFDFGEAEFKEDNLKEIEKKMKNIIKQNQKFEQYNLSIDESIKFLKEKWEIYKVEMGEDLKKEWEKELSFYKNISQQWVETFVDMCVWPHVSKTLDIDENSFKLDKIAGAYWKWDSERKMLTRIYAFAFDTREELDNYLKMLEEAKKRDHRILWQKLDLFCFSDLVGAGLPLFTPKWTILKEELQKHVESVCYKFWFQKVITPHLSKIALYEISWHAKKFWDELFHVTSNKKHEFVMKPVQCPHQTQIYASKSRSYRDLPIRYMESERQYRAEQTGEVWWLNRVYAITVEDWHTFCRVDQVKNEIIWMVNIIKDFYSWLGLWWNHWVSLSVRDYSNPDKYIWTSEDWDICEKMLQEVSDELWLNAKKCEWEAALYWPKLDFMFRDAIWKEIQIPTVQVDFATPKRFNLLYTDKDWEKKNPVMVHRAILWSYERFMALIIEHFAWSFPLWLAPVQVIVVPVWENFISYGDEIYKKLKEAWIRVEFDDGTDSLNKKVRNAEQLHINYILVVWEKEEKENSISVRNYKTKEQKDFKLDEFITEIKKEIEEKRI